MLRSTRRQVLTAEEAWRRYDEVEARLTAPLSERMLDLAGVQAGSRVLDLASGRGEPAIRAARRAGESGSVLGVELSEALIRMAKERAESEGIANLELIAGNAESPVGVPRGYFDAATIRWGLMYMADPVAALANVRDALIPTGALVVALWAEPERVRYYTLPRRLLERYRRLPAIDPEAPGTFRFAEMGRVTRDFEEAGLAVDHVEEMEIPVFEAEEAAEVVGWARAVLGLTRLLNELPEEEQRAWEEELTSEMERSRGSGPARIGGVTRIVRARPR